MSWHNDDGRRLGRKWCCRTGLVAVSALGALLLGCAKPTEHLKDGSIRDLPARDYSTGHPSLSVPVLAVISPSGWWCEAQLLESDWSYPTSFTRALAPPEARSFPACTLAESPESVGVDGLDEIELWFDGSNTLPDVIDITWFARVPKSEADVLHVTECAIAITECRMAADRGAVVVKPPTEAAKAGVWALWVTPEGVEIGPDGYDAFNTAFWGVSLR